MMAWMRKAVWIVGWMGWIMVRATGLEQGASSTGHLAGEAGFWCAHGHWHAVGSDTGDRRRYAPDRQVDIRHLRLEVTPDFRNQSVEGTATLEFSAMRYPVSVLRLDAVDLRVERVEGQPEVGAWVNDDRQIHISFAEPLAPGQEGWVRITYSATPSKGLYFRTVDRGHRAGDVHLFTQGETIEARHWYPSFDAPNDKFTTEVHCRVPVEMTVLSNGRLLGETLDPATGTKVVRWRTDKPHVNYLVSLVAGYFKTLRADHRGLPMAFHTAPSQFHMAERSMEDTGACMAYFEEEIGVPYPWEKYDQVCVQDFMWGGMENTSVTTLTDRTLSVPEMETLASSRGLVAHELAHQWFGDLVTCKDWAHVWLNEGFATYYTLLFTRHVEGRDAFLYDLWNTGQQVLALTPERDRRPIVFREYDHPDGSLMPGVWVYNKGAWVLHMLRSQLGEPAFRDAVRLFLQRHAYDVAVTHDLIRILEEVSGRSLDGFFDQWVFGRHHPHLAVEHSWDAALGLSRVTVRQTQPVSGDIPLFRFPLTLRFKGEFGVKDLTVEVSESRQDFHMRLPSAPRSVRVDPDLELLAKIQFEPSRSMVEADAADPDDMLGRLLAVRRLGRDKDARAIGILAGRLNDDTFHGVRVEAARSLGKIGTDASREALLACGPQTDARVRRAVVEELGRQPAPGILATLREWMGSETNPGVLSVMVQQLAGYALDEVRPDLEQAMARESFRDQVASAAIRIVSDQGSTEYWQPILDQLEQRAWLYPMDGMTTRISALARLARLAGETGPAREWFQARAAHPRPQVATAALRALGDLGDARAMAFLSAWTRQPDAAIAEAARQAMDQLRKDQPPRVEIRDLREGLEKVQRESEDLRTQLRQVQSRLEALLRVGESETP